jgi:hypothetical protein
MRSTSIPSQYIQHGRGMRQTERQPGSVLVFQFLLDIILFVGWITNLAPLQAVKLAIVALIVVFTVVVVIRDRRSTHYNNRTLTGICTFPQ